MQVMMTMEEYEFFKKRSDEWHHFNVVSQKLDAWREAISCPESWEVLDWITHLRSMTQTSIMVLGLSTNIERELARAGLTTVNSVKGVIRNDHWKHFQITRANVPRIVDAYNAYSESQSVITELATEES